VYITIIYRNDKEGREQHHDDGQKPATKLAGIKFIDENGGARMYGWARRTQSVRRARDR
jgi:hypothetical protein